jgi:hypothetical protein
MPSHNQAPGRTPGSKEKVCEASTVPGISYPLIGRTSTRTHHL